MSRLTITGLCKSYDRAPVLTGLDLEAPAGSLTAVLGLSGCGKTTMLRILAGFERADGGVVRLGEQILDEQGRYLAPERRGIGYVPQEGALFPHLNVAGNVGFGLSRRERAGNTVTELLELVGLAELERRFPHQLSGGEQQRVALARALARRPDLLLLDEPFSSLDASLRGRMREDVRALLHQQGITTVLVTHDQEEALSLGDVLAVLRDGRIVQQGTPEQLYNEPVDAPLARFLGAANVLSASFSDGLAHTALGTLRLRPLPATVGEPPNHVLLRPEQLAVQRAEPAPGVQLEAQAPGTQREASRTGGLPGVVERCDYYGHDAILRILPSEPCGTAVLLARVEGEQALPTDTRVLVAARGLATALAEPLG
jgi:iron(III) transport system ATP-binding protein